MRSLTRGQVRELRYDSSRHFDLDDVLLIFGQIGLMAYNIFTVIAGYYTINEDEDSALVLLSALAALFQVSARLHEDNYLLPLYTITYNNYICPGCNSNHFHPGCVPP
jgi:hypothetical protein